MPALFQLRPSKCHTPELEEKTETSVLDVPNAGITSAAIEGLTAGTWYFTVSSYTNTGVESTPTAAVSFTVQ